jgi:hypothetical protein
MYRKKYLFVCLWKTLFKFYQTPDPHWIRIRTGIRIRIRLKCWIRIRIRIHSMRIRNTVSNYVKNIPVPVLF